MLTAGGLFMRLIITKIKKKEKSREDYESDTQICFQNLEIYLLTFLYNTKVQKNAFFSKKIAEKFA